MRRWAGDGHCSILGDFNVPLIDWDENRCLPGADQFSRDLEVANQLTLHQHSREPTRIHDSAQSVLDLVLSPRTSDVDVIDHLQPLGSSDYSTCWCIGDVELRIALDHIPDPMSGKRTTMA
ncbi:unnamed protein product [Echinostoma caproni]|uniref:Endo/exonuclease/phosphatase domain-containing protein n=1 Tax=Echinostoma caproni TaxID=27848 RepID=A0A183BH38_9TREM|nr:unnamed protein product [Echinostoma caproni]